MFFGIAWVPKNMLTKQGHFHDQCCCCCPTQDRDSLMRDWMVGKSTLQAEITQKTAFWKIIPHKLAGLLCPDVAKAAAVAESCIAQFDSSPLEWHHRLSKWFLLPGGRLRAGVEALRSGGVLFDQALEFKLSVLRFAGISVVERSVESKHAQAQRFVTRARRFSGASVSLNLRLPEITRRLQRDSAMFSDLTKLLRFHEFHSMRDLYSLLHLLGLSGHPAIKDIPGQVHQKTAVLVTYHLDAQSQLRLPEVYAQVIRLDAAERKKRLQEAKATASKLGHAALPAASAEDVLRALTLRAHGQAMPTIMGLKDSTFFLCQGSHETTLRHWGLCHISRAL